MDYLGHRGLPDLSSHDSARAFFTQIDRQFHRAAWFALGADAPLFSGLLEYDALRGRRVLEVGCGLGAISAELARRGARVIALDLTWTAVAATAKRFGLDRLRASAVEGDVAKLPFANASFDFLWCWGVLPHTPDLAAALATTGIRVFDVARGYTALPSDGDYTESDWVDSDASDRLVTASSEFRAPVCVRAL